LLSKGRKFFSYWGRGKREGCYQASIKDQIEGRKKANCWDSGKRRRNFSVLERKKGTVLSANSFQEKRKRKNFLGGKVGKEKQKKE